MKICILAPSFQRPHGGLRVIAEWANNLAKLGHEIHLHSSGKEMLYNWVEISDEVTTYWGGGDYLIDIMIEKVGPDAVIATTPPTAIRLDSIHYSHLNRFYFLQMLEHYFRPDNRKWVQDCQKSYRVNYPIISISEWNAAYLVEKAGVDPGNIYMIGNGVSEHFKPDPEKRDEGMTVLVEGWNGYNYAKDTERFGPRIADWLSKNYPEVKIISYAQKNPVDFQEIFRAGTGNEFYRSIGTEKIKELCQRSHFMIKATRYDARSCACVEAMACGTPTVRSLLKGDDDLIHGYNSLRSLYPKSSSDKDTEQLFGELVYNVERMLKDSDLREQLAENGLEYRDRKLSWQYWMKRVEKILAE